MTIYDHKAILSLPVRPGNKMKAKTVGEHLAAVQTLFLRHEEELIEYRYDTTEGERWQNELGCAFMDAGIISAEDGTDGIPDWDATLDVIDYLTSKALNQNLPDRTWRSKATSEDLRELLNCTMQTNDAGAATIGEYLAKLALKVWVEEEDFNGKRPFGNSNWKSEITATLIGEMFVDGEFDEDGDIQTVDSAEVDELLTAAVKELFHQRELQQGKYFKVTEAAAGQQKRNRR